MNLEQFLTLLIVGALAGWLAGLILNRRGFGFAGNLIIGVIGSFLGRFVLGELGFHAGTRIALLITALLGSLLLLWILSFVPRSGARKK
jgi:uncharacterized membrane protein YeaQ/YmgE (transglycosylase-associated protein family)